MYNTVYCKMHGVGVSTRRLRLFDTFGTSIDRATRSYDHAVFTGFDNPERNQIEMSDVYLGYTKARESKETYSRGCFGI